MSKPALLYLVHRIPFPPNKGDKIRSYNILRELNKSFDVHVVCFIDDATDSQYVDTLASQCASLYVETQRKWWSLFKSTTGLLTRQALSIPYYSSVKMQRVVDNLIEQHQISQALVFSSTMGQFLSKHSHLHTVIDFVDVDSDKWRQYANKGSGFKRWVYQREHQLLQHTEQQLCNSSAYSLFVSPQEAELFRSLMPDSLSSKIDYLYNGVDVDYFDPCATDIDALKENAADVCFTGAMDYWANVDAVLWFVENVWPTVRKQRPSATFAVVGGNPTDKIQQLHGQNGIFVTGRVKDVRPYVLQAKINVAPLQIARGIQNKILEALALAKPVIATSLAMEGIDARTDAIDIVDSAPEFAQRVIAHIDAPLSAEQNRQWVSTHLLWDVALSRLTKKLALPHSHQDQIQKD